MTTNKTLLETLMKIKEMLLNLQSISPEADNCYYKDECGKNCTPKKEQRTKMKKDYKEVKLDFQTHIENPCMWEELEKIISIVEQALAPQECDIENNTIDGVKYPHICAVHYAIDKGILDLIDGSNTKSEEILLNKLYKLNILATNMGQRMEDKLIEYKQHYLQQTE